MSGPVWSFLGLSGAVWGCLGLSGAIQGRVRDFMAIYGDPQRNTIDIYCDQAQGTLKLLIFTLIPRKGLRIWCYLR